MCLSFDASHHPSETSCASVLKRSSSAIFCTNSIRIAVAAQPANALINEHTNFCSTKTLFRMYCIRLARDLLDANEDGLQAFSCRRKTFGIYDS